MAELANCSKCGTVFVKGIRDICQNCFREEEKAFEIVYEFLRKRKNREATIMEIVEATEVEESLIIQFIRQKRLRSSDFPNLAYPCERCQTPITTGRLCNECSHSLIEGFKNEEIKTEENEEREPVYLSNQAENEE